MKKSVCLWAFVVAAAAVFTGCSTMRPEEVNVPWSTVPAVVQSTIQAHLYGGTVGKVEVENMKCGVVYEAEVKGPDGQRSEVKVAADGKLLKYRTCNNK